MPKRVVITGGAGFIGSHTAEEFLANNYEVVVIDSLRSGSKDNLNGIAGKIEFVEGDVRDKSLLEKVFKNGDVIVHLAAFVSVPQSINDPAESHDINVNGANAVYLAAKEAGARRVISASSAAVYGETGSKATREDYPLTPMSPYALHKAITEQYGKLYAELFGTSHMAMRFFNVYGPRQVGSGGYAAVIAAFAELIKQGKPATINGDGTAVRDFIYVKDVARAIRLAAEYDVANSSENSVNSAGQKFNAFNIATGHPITINELWKTICAVLGKNIEVLHGPARQGDIRVSLADVSKAKSELGFEAKTQLNEGLKKLFE